MFHGEPELDRFALPLPVDGHDPHRAAFRRDRNAGPEQSGLVDGLLVLVDGERKEARGRGRVINFFIQVWAELRRVQWPTRSQVTQATAVVVVFCLIAGVYLGFWDYVFNELVKKFL